MAASRGTLCPFCNRVVGLTPKSGTLYAHMPYDHKSQADVFSAGRRCHGSFKTPQDAGVAKQEQDERARQVWKEVIRGE
jgi:hypothetical protein